MSERTLELALASLRSVLDRLVVVGGTAHRLFPMHPLANPLDAPLLTTEDVDFAAPLELEHDGSRELLARLTRAGFRESVGGVDPPVHTYHLDEPNGAYLQFIAPKRGPDRRRSGERASRTLRFSGLIAERLREVDLLMKQPWPLALTVEGRSTQVLVVNPSAFLLQKLLLLGNPTRTQSLPDDPIEGSGGTKRGKDLLYIYDTIGIFADELEALGAKAALPWDSLSTRLVRRAGRELSKLASSPTDVCREAAIIAASQRSDPPSPGRIAGVCHRGLEVVLRRIL